MLMKKILLCAAMLATTVAASQAQTIANAGFETWQGPSGLLQLENPNSWYGSDKTLSDLGLLLAAVGVTPEKQIFKTEDAHSGSYAAELKTAFLGDTVGNVPALLINAKINFDLMAILANPDFSNFLDHVTYTGGTPVLGKKVDTVKAWVKLTGDQQDQSSIIINAMKKGKTASNADTMIMIGTGNRLINPNSANAYEEVSVPMNYISSSNTATDTLIIVFSSSAVISSTTPTTDGNTLKVDDVTMITSDGTSPTSIREPVFREDIAVVYPNPATNLIYFNLNAAERPSDYTLTVTDIAGRVVLQEQLKEQINPRSLNHWTKGSYAYSLVNTKTNKSEQGKFVVQ
jgi:hypothetical protein